MDGGCARGGRRMRGRRHAAHDREKEDGWGGAGGGWGARPGPPRREAGVGHARQEGGDQGFELVRDTVTQRGDGFSQHVLDIRVH